MGFMLLRPIMSNCFFKQASLDSGFQQWHGNGIVYFKDLFIDNAMASSQQLSEKLQMQDGQGTGKH